MKKAVPKDRFLKKLLKVSDLQALLGKASARSRSLTGFEPWVGFADHVNGAFALHNLTVSVAAFGGREG